MKLRRNIRITWIYEWVYTAAIFGNWGLDSMAAIWQTYLGIYIYMNEWCSIIRIWLNIVPPAFIYNVYALVWAIYWIQTDQRQSLEPKIKWLKYTFCAVSYLREDFHKVQVIFGIKALLLTNYVRQVRQHWVYPYINDASFNWIIHINRHSRHAQITKHYADWFTFY